MKTTKEIWIGLRTFSALLEPTRILQNHQLYGRNVARRKSLMIGDHLNDWWNCIIKNVQEKSVMFHNGTQSICRHTLWWELTWLNLSTCMDIRTPVSKNNKKKCFNNLLLNRNRSCGLISPVWPYSSVFRVYHCIKRSAWSDATIMLVPGVQAPRSSVVTLGNWDILHVCMGFL